MRLSIILCSLALPWTAHAHADDNIVTIAADKLQQRRDDNAAVSIVRHAEIVAQGDRSLFDVLKRLPGISVAGAPGQGGQIRMRGLGDGYTLIMLDGVAAPNGFSIDALDPELIERIEIRRAATAEFSAQAIAGSINIVLRKAVPDSQREIKLGLADSGGRAAGNAALQWSRRDGRLSASLATSVNHASSSVAIGELERRDAAAGQPSLLRSTPQTETQRSDTLELTPRLAWTQDDATTLVLQNFLSVRRLAKRHRAMEIQLAGAASTYPSSVSSFNQDSVTLRSDLSWARKLAGGAALEFKFGLQTNRRDNDFVFDGFGADRNWLATHLVASGVVDTGWSSNGTYRLPAGARHTLAAGWEAGKRRRSEFRDELRNELRNGVQLSAGPQQVSANNYGAGVRRLAGFVQDEWEVTPRWSLYLGLRHESLRTDSAGVAPIDAGVWSPLLQSRWRLAGKDQLRLALSRTYKAPELFDLVPRRYVIDNGNSAANPDRQGNPGLRPELAWGLDGAYEVYPAAGALLSASAFVRRIRDVTLEQLEQLSSDDGRWLATPVNGGAASVRGIELEAKLPLKAWLADGPALDLRANVARNWSRVAALPGPDNRLASQTPLTANLGADYRLAALPLALSASFTYQRGAAARTSRQLIESNGAKRELDLSAVWTSRGGGRLRLSVANLLAQEYVERSQYKGTSEDAGGDASGSLLRTVGKSSQRVLRLMWEGKL